MTELRAAPSARTAPTLPQLARRAALHAQLVAAPWFRRCLGCAVVVLLVIAATTTYLRLGVRSTPVALDDVVSRYRRSVQAVEAPVPTPADAAPTAAAAPTDPVHVEDRPGSAPASSSAAAPRPAPPGTGPGAAARPGVEPGVYVYATKGYDEVDLPGHPHHTFPERTTITVTERGGCDDSRWDLLEERWDVWATCSNGGALLIEHIFGHAEFFGFSGGDSYRCPAGSVVLPVDRSAGTPVARRCDGDNGSMTVTGRVVGTETVMVGGLAVAAVHVTADVVYAGATEGTQKLDEWYAADSDLLLRRIRSTDVTNSSVMSRPVGYEERVEAVLTSLEPRR
jgi:hypothetical protein